MLTSTLNYLRPLWEGDDNKPSIRRILAIGFFVGVIRMIEISYTKTCALDNNVLTTLCGTILILLVIITAQNILKFKQTNVNTQTGQTNTTETQPPAPSA